MDVDVLGYISAMKQGNIDKAARQISFDCIQCGLVRQPLHGRDSPVPYRLSWPDACIARFVQPQAEHLKSRVAEIQSGKYDGILSTFTQWIRKTLEKLYTEREREPDMAPPASVEAARYPLSIIECCATVASNLDLPRRRRSLSWPIQLK